MANLSAALIYVYAQFFYIPTYFVVIGHNCWQLAHGVPAFVYISLNKTIQREVFQMLKNLKPPQATVAPSTGTNLTKAPCVGG
ncbi:hypothetical protein KIN20_003765 [Parelaphostrongylus tenuis]|uniref:Uncharacterized protein n=1 Tax=Parelaphostrongylus tenuis TaxID=148309 RepID=A0AAD5QDY3_PARTN|nr:hypothetical protein KIN20_003765 [Parelaphostrongylus tenuis]